MTKTENLAIVLFDILHRFRQYNVPARPQFKTFDPKIRKAVQIDPMIVGTEWLIEAAGCPAEALRDELLLRRILARVIDELGLKTIDSVWHKFPGEGGVTALVALTESHLACHTYPEHGIATFNLYCCRTRPEWDWEANLKQELGACSVTVLKVERGRQTASLCYPKSKIQNSKSVSAGGDA